MRVRSSAALSFALAMPFVGCIDIGSRIDSATKVGALLARIMTGERAEYHIELFENGQLLLYHGANLFGKADDIQTFLSIISKVEFTSLDQLSLAVIGSVAMTVIHELGENLVSLRTIAELLMSP